METRRVLLAKCAVLLGAALLPIKTLFARTTPTFTDADYKKAMAFIEGDQWPTEIRVEREAAGRPALVFNRVLCIFQRKAYDQKLVRGSDEWKALAVDIYRKTADHQRLINLYQSNIAEHLRLPAKLTLSGNGKIETVDTGRDAALDIMSFQRDKLARELSA